MYLYIHIPNGHQADRQGVTVPVSGITLKDGYIPTVSGQVLPLKADDGSPLQLEPAVWFKVLVLDSIYIDCTSQKRSIMWNSAILPDLRGFEDSVSSTSSSSTDSLRRRNSKFRKRISESMYLGGECYGCGSDVDEAFEIAQKAACDFTQQLISSMEFYETVLRILHCYILPSIELTQDELPKLSEAYNFQKTMVDKVDGRIMKENNKAEEVANSKARQRRKFAEELSLLVNTGTRPAYPAEFTTMLYTDIQKDILDSWDEVNNLQTIVDKAKERLAKLPSNENEQSLQECRLQRNTGQDNHEKLLKVREILHGMTNSKPIASANSGRKKSKKSKRKSVDTNTLLTAIYMEMEKKYNELIGAIMRTTDEKVLILSVKEAMKQAIADLDKGDETTGMDINSTGLRKPTDVLRRPSMPNLWKTVTEQVTSIVLDPQNELSAKHDQFCKEIIDTCKRAAALLERCSEPEKAVIAGHGQPGDPPTLHTCVLAPGDNVSSDSDSDSFLGENAMFRENELYVNMNHIQHVEKDPNKNDIDPRSYRKGDSSIYINFNPDFDPATNRGSTLSLLADEQCTSCFGRLSIIDPTAVQEGTHVAQKAEQFHQMGVSPEYGGKHFENVDSLHNSNENMEIVFSGRDPEEMKDMVSEIRNSIKNHIGQMVTRLKEELHGAPSDQLHRKVWSCYESHFYERVISHLTRFYDVAYRHITTKFCESLTELSVEDLEMENSFILHLLKDKDTKQSDNEMECDSESVQSSVESSVEKLPLSGSADMVEMVAMASQCYSPSPPNQNNDSVYVPNILSSRLDELPPVSVPIHVESTTVSVLGATGFDSPPDSSHNSDASGDGPGKPYMRHSSVPMRRKLPGLLSGKGVLSTDTSSKRITRYGRNAFTDYTEHKVESQHLLTIQELQADDSSSTGSTTGSGSSESVSKKSSDSSSENLSSREGTLENKSSDLSNELILFTDSNETCRESRSFRVSVPCSLGAEGNFERSTWPMLGNRSSADQDSMGRGEGRDKRPPPGSKRPLPPPSSKDHLILLDKYKNLSTDALKSIVSVIKESSPLAKLQFLTKCLRELSEDIREISEEIEGDSDAASADKQLDYLIVFLCNCDAKIVSKLYVNVNLLNDIIPSFLESGPFAYALVQFQMAFSFLNDRILSLSRAAMPASSC